MSPYQLRTDVVIQLLGDPEFYRACPEFLWLDEHGLACHKAYQAALLKPVGCDNCNGQPPDPRIHIEPALYAFVKHVRKLAALRLDLLATLKAYLGQRLGFQPPQVVLYYKDQGARKQLVF